MVAATQRTHLDAILDYFHAKARQRSEVIGMSPLTLYLHLTSIVTEDSVALPDAPINEDISTLLPQVSDYFVHRRRVPRIQFLDRQCPTLEGTLTDAGYTLDEKLPLLTCTPKQLKVPERPAPIAVTVLTADSPDDLLAEGWQLNNEGFGGRKSTTTQQEIAHFRQMLIGGRAFSAYVEGVGVGAGMYNEPLDQVAELVGIATLPPFRRHGVAATLTAAITARAFAEGVTLAFLIAASPEASRVYLRLGYEFSGHLVTMTHQSAWDVPF